MTTERLVRIFGGSVVLLSLALSEPSSPIFLARNLVWVAVFVGANLVQSGFTRFCPLEILLRKAGVPSIAVSPR
jgi:hypothetical protein